MTPLRIFSIRCTAIARNPAECLREIAFFSLLLLAALIVAPAPGHAGSAARQIQSPAGAGPQVIMPPSSGFSTVPGITLGQPLGDRDQIRRLRLLADIQERRDQGIGRAPRQAPSKRIVVERSLHDYPFCIRGLFGRAVNKPCRIRPDATILNRR